MDQNECFVLMDWNGIEFVTIIKWMKFGFFISLRITLNTELGNEIEMAILAYCFLFVAFVLIHLFHSIIM